MLAAGKHWQALSSDCCSLGLVARGVGNRLGEAGWGGLLLLLLPRWWHPFEHYISLHTMKSWRGGGSALCWQQLKHWQALSSDCCSVEWGARCVGMRL